MTTDRLISEFRLQYFSKQPYAGSSIEDQNLVAIGSDFDAGRITTETHVFSLWRWSRPTNPPEADAHRLPLDLENPGNVNQIPAARLSYQHHIFQTHSAHSGIVESWLHCNNVSGL